jgi:hypothetical protein
MAGVLERMRRPRKQLVKPCSPLSVASLKVLELQTAKEILIPELSRTPTTPAICHTLLVVSLFFPSRVEELLVLPVEVRRYRK